MYLCVCFVFVVVVFKCRIELKRRKVNKIWLHKLIKTPNKNEHSDDSRWAISLPVAFSYFFFIESVSRVVRTPHRHRMYHSTCVYLRLCVSVSLEFYIEEIQKLSSSFAYLSLFGFFKRKMKTWKGNCVEGSQGNFNWAKMHVKNQHVDGVALSNVTQKKNSQIFFSFMISHIQKVTESHTQYICRLHRKWDRVTYGCWYRCCYSCCCCFFVIHSNIQSGGEVKNFQFLGKAFNSFSLFDSLHITFILHVLLRLLKCCVKVLFLITFNCGN